MSKEAISTILLTIASISIVVMLINGAFPAMSRTTYAYDSYSKRLEEKIKTDIKIIHEMNESMTVEDVWIKNVGTGELLVAQIEDLDLFFGPSTNFQRIPFNNSTSPSWSYVLENDGDSDGRWDTGETIKVTISMDSSFTTGEYYVKVVSTAGISASDYFSII